ncbi:MAG TPA: hypothetical protein VMV15_06170 [Candidatus Binataceae bacterium]|nr:hypothetical protein [Candidatus Binataceae bacterium]
MGVATDICCGAIAHDATMLDYKVLFAADGQRGLRPAVLEG